MLEIIKINGTKTESPENIAGLELGMSYENGNGVPFLSNNELVFKNNSAKLLYDLTFSGLSGGVGVFENPKLELLYKDYFGNSVTIESRIDLRSINILSKDTISVNLASRTNEDFLTNVADAYSFRYLHSIGAIKNTDFTKIKYVLNYRPELPVLIGLAISIFTLSKILLENLYEIGESVSELVNSLTPNVGLGVTWDIGDVIWIVLKTAVKIAYSIALVVAISKLASEIIEQIFPKLRNHFGINLKKLLTKSFNHLGLQFKSTIFDNFAKDFVLLPAKEVKGDDLKNLGIPLLDSANDNFGTLLRNLIAMFNADFRISNGIFEFERYDFWKQNSVYKLPNIFTNQERLSDKFSLNTDEIVSNYLISFSIDSTDMNTLDNVDRRVFQATTSPIIINEKTQTTISNLENINLPFSYGIRKNGLNQIEKVAKELAKLVDNLTGIFGGGTNFVSKIKKREGALLLSDHFFINDKLIITDGENLSTSQRDKINAQILWENFHYLSSFVDVNGWDNQHYIYSDIEIPMSLQDYKNLLDNKFFKDHNGVECELLELNYREFDKKGTISYKRKKKYTNNLKINYVT